ncbi:MAG TPA: homocysteine S-methyltransferase family protein, partial [Candidatus Limnocylindrales bacterium]|nr:homocysteine S-methyltransferase family protein [Candidatus Limnocylindrales bacterium]
MNARERFRTRLAAGPLLADGAMGTLLYSRGVPQRANLDELVTTRPDLISGIHREYLEAGAELIETATFGANRARLAAHGMSDRAAALSRRGAQLAREARDVSGREAWVAGSVGPLGAPTRELLHLPDSAVRAAVREQLDGLLEGGVDLFIFETFTLLSHLLLAVDEARGTADLPIIAQLTYGEELQLPDGTVPATAAAALLAGGADVVGVNCGGGPVACAEALEAMAQGVSGAAGPGQPVASLRSVMPNAGLPQRIEGQFVYAASPAYLGGIVPRFLAAGATILGGCCGTTPEHIAAMRAVLDALPTAGPPVGTAQATATTPSETVSTIRSVPTAAEPYATPRSSAEPSPPTALGRALAGDHFVISVEIDPP